MAGIVLRGRSEQMTVALGLIRRVTRTGRAEGLVISGEAGIGKSALLSAVVREAGRLDAVCATVRADKVARVVPGGPLLTALRDGPDPVLPTAASTPLESLTDQPLLLLEALTNALELRAAERAVVVAIDDAKWLDDLSAFVLRSLPGRLPTSPITWLLASRAASLPLLEVLRGNQDGDPPFTSIDLRPLAVSDIMAIALDQLGVIPGPAPRQLLERAGGNPFLATKVIRVLLRAQENGVDPCDLPEQLVHAVRRQLQTLSSDAVQLVRLAAVYGEALSVDDAAELLDGLSAQVVAEAAEEATTE
jgi:predicted ATPase